MRILLVAYHFPPDPAVGSLRAAKLANAFRSDGHSVTTITARLASEKQTYRELQSGWKIRTVRRIPLARELYARGKKLVSSIGGRGRNGSPSSHNGDGLRYDLEVPSWKRKIFSLIWLPDDRQGFIPTAVQAALQEMRTGVDLVYTTAPPFSSHLAGLVLKRATGVKWAVEFRDPWTDNTWKPGYMRSHLGDGAERWLEKQCLQSADYVISVTEGIHRFLSSKVEDHRSKTMLTVLNGIEEVARADSGASPKRPVRIVHVGTFYMHRDPRPFLKAFASLRNKHGWTPHDIVLEMVGNCRYYHDISIEGLARDYGISDLVIFRDWVTHRESLELIRSADLLLLLAQAQVAQVPNKLYEYLGSRKPVLAFTEEESETGRMLRRMGGHYITSTTEPDRIEPVMESAILSSMNRSPRSYEDSLLVEWSTQHQMQKLLAALAH